ncbi:MAG: prepilin peptidase [Hyphomonadaceae bacterium]|nr:prepilin peptidase [Hyphomonadaceae bacterium]
MLLTLAAFAFLALCLFGALTDIASLTIPNWLNATIAALGVSALAVSGFELGTIGWHLGIAVLAFVASFALFTFGIFGGGDAKMIPAVALWMGPTAIVPFLFWMALVGGLLALIGTLAKYAPLPEGAPVWVSNTLSKGEGVPYGVAIAAGAFMGALQAPLLLGPVSLAGLAG